MKRLKRLLAAAFLTMALSFAVCQPALAISEADVQAKVEASGKESVTGNVLIWFLCAIAFLKVSQKVDSFMSGLGINVGHTGGNMIAELMVAARGLGTARNVAGGRFRLGGGSSGGTGSPGRNGGMGSPGSPGSAGGFLSGGLAGVASRQVKNGAAAAVTAASASAGNSGGAAPGKGKGGMPGGIPGMVGGQIYKSSVAKGGSFANDIISRVATGSIAVDGTIDGTQAAEALQSYMGYTALGAGAANVPAFTDVEIGGGRITGTETSAKHPDGIAFGMYNAAQYTAPEGAYDTVHTADGAAWYRQYAVDAVEKSPYMAADGSIAYNESIVKKLPPVPRRKDRI
jgi:hypothetical protein|nr:hypothetical protein [uncultured Acetatifactor sp.]